MYSPLEDSIMLAKQVKKHAHGKVLDMGTGTGIQAYEAGLKKEVKSVLGADIDAEAIKYCKKNVKNPKIKWVISDLFKNVKGKFDTIIFNPPYLPQEGQKRDIATEGGRKGWETIAKFLPSAYKQLNDKGIILLLFSAFTDKQKVEKLILENKFSYQQIAKEHYFFEDLYVYLLQKRKEILKYKNIKYLASGKRSHVFKTGKLAIKCANEQSTATGNFQNEANMLKILNKHKIGPKLVASGETFVVYEFAPGKFLKDTKLTKKIALNVLEQCRTMDKLGINKQEMTRPLKHVIIGKKITLIDFERARKTQKPQNLTQFCEYLSRMLKKPELRELAKKYKQNYCEETYSLIQAYLKKNLK